MVGSDLLYRCRHLGPGHPEVAGLILDNPSSLTVLVEPLGTRGEPVGFLRLYGIRLTSAIAFLETAVARRGWGVEASRLLVAYAMDTLGLHRIEAKVYRYNTPSINLLYPLGIPSNAVFALALGLAIVRYRLLDLGMVAKWAILYMLTAATMGPALIGAIYGVDRARAGRAVHTGSQVHRGDRAGRRRRLAPAAQAGRAPGAPDVRARARRARHLDGAEQADGLHLGP